MPNVLSSVSALVSYVEEHAHSNTPRGSGKPVCVPPVCRAEFSVALPAVAPRHNHFGFGLWKVKLVMPTTFLFLFSKSEFLLAFALEFLLGFLCLLLLLALLLYSHLEVLDFLLDHILVVAAVDS